MRTCHECGYQSDARGANRCPECGARQGFANRCAIAWRAGAFFGALCALPVGHHASSLALTAVETARHTRMGSSEVLFFHLIALGIASGLLFYWIDEAAAGRASSSRRTRLRVIIVLAVGLDLFSFPVMRALSL